MPARSSGAAASATGSRCSARCPTTGRNSAITGCRIQAYGSDTLIYRASLGSSAAAKLAAGALAMKDRLSGRGDAVEIGRRL